MSKVGWDQHRLQRWNALRMAVLAARWQMLSGCDGPITVLATAVGPREYTPVH